MALLFCLFFTRRTFKVFSAKLLFISQSLNIATLPWGTDRILLNALKLVSKFD